MRFTFLITFLLITAINAEEVYVFDDDSRGYSELSLSFAANDLDDFGAVDNTIGFMLRFTRKQQQWPVGLDLSFTKDAVTATSPGDPNDYSIDAEEIAIGAHYRLVDEPNWNIYLAGGLVHSDLTYEVDGPAASRDSDSGLGLYAEVGFRIFGEFTAFDMGLRQTYLSLDLDNSSSDGDGSRLIIGIGLAF